MSTMNGIWAGATTRLRGVEPEDWQYFRALAEDAGDVRHADVVEPPRSAEGFRAWTVERAVRAPGGDAFRLVVESLDGGVFVGSVTVGECDSRAGRFKMGIEIAREHRRQGHAAEATELVLTYMFGERRFHKCEVEVYAFNDASLDLFRKLGFIEEGRLREHEFFAGGHHDLVLLGRTAVEHWAAHPRPPVR